jgi:hypothetical protein
MNWLGNEKPVRYYTSPFFTPFFKTVKKFLGKHCLWFVTEPGATTTMADFVLNSQTKSAIRELATPIASVSTFNLIVPQSLL